MKYLYRPGSGNNRIRENIRSALEKVGILNPIKQIYRSIYNFVSRNRTIQVSVADWQVSMWVPTVDFLEHASTLGGERKELTHFLTLVKPNSIVWDVGANDGMYALFSAVKGAETHAFEPDPTNVCVLERNIKINHLNKLIHVHQMALADFDGVADIFGTSQVNFTLANLTEKKSTGQVTVLRGESVIDRKLSILPTIIKMDVEGFEYEVIQGLSAVLAKVKSCNIMIENHDQILASRGLSTRRETVILKGLEFTQIADWSAKRKTWWAKG